MLPSRLARPAHATVFPLALALSIIGILSACSSTDSCDQDYMPPISISTSTNPYHFSTLSSDLSITSARWENITTGASGPGAVSQVYDCVFPVGCGTWTKIEMDIYLTAGLNTVYTYETSDGCEWRSDYLITYN